MICIELVVSRIEPALLKSALLQWIEFYPHMEDQAEQSDLPRSLLGGSDMLLFQFGSSNVSKSLILFAIICNRI